MMGNETIATKIEEEFEALADHFIIRGEDKLAPQTFLQVMTDVAEQPRQHEVKFVENVSV